MPYQDMQQFWDGYSEEEWAQWYSDQENWDQWYHDEPGQWPAPEEEEEDDDLPSFWEMFTVGWKWLASWLF